jgi:GTPases - Sulfate adenylate transferase subunit 1
MDDVLLFVFGKEYVLKYGIHKILVIIVRIVHCVDVNIFERSVVLVLSFNDIG